MPRKPTLKETIQAALAGYVYELVVLPGWAAVLCHANRVALLGGRCGDFLVDDPARKAMAHRLRSGCRARAARGCLR